MGEKNNFAFHNTCNLLRSIYLQLPMDEEQIPGRQQPIHNFLDALRGLKAY